MKKFFSIAVCILLVCSCISPAIASDLDVTPWIADVTIDSLSPVIDSTEKALNTIVGVNGAVDTALNDILKIVLYGSDIYPALEAAADDSNFDGDVTGYLFYQMRRYSSGVAEVQFTKDMLIQGVDVLHDGSIVLGDQVTNWIGDFVDWLWDASNGPNLIQYSDAVDGSVLEHNGVRVVPITMGTTDNNNNGIYNTLPLYYLTGTSSANWVYVSRESKLYMGKYGNDIIFIVNFNDSSITYGVVTRQDVGYSYLTPNIGIPAHSFKANSSSVYYHGLLWDILPASDVMPTGSMYLSDFQREQNVKGNPDWINPGFKFLVILSDIYNPSANVTSPGVVTPFDYIHGVGDSLDGKPVNIPVYNPDTGDPVGSVTLDPNGEPLGGNTVDTIPENALTNPFGNISDGDGLGDFRLNINFRDLFPFCIPYDIYDLLSTFTADAEAPHFEFPIKSEIGGIDETIEFDLSQFDSVAAVLRKLELVAFAVGLAFITKQLIN